jgi:hypothetical protein
MADEDDVLESPEEREAYDAREVKQLIGLAGWKRALAATEDRITKEWERGNNPLEREMAWHKLQAFKMLQRELRAYGDRPVVLK